MTLLEEPQAAFYCWLATHGHAEASKLKPGALCVVVDVGGGTTDFSLIGTSGRRASWRSSAGGRRSSAARRRQHGPGLAKFVETKLPQAGKLDAASTAS
jgi:molecular chaperone DnaK (HSP70)